MSHRQPLQNYFRICGNNVLFIYRALERFLSLHQTVTELQQILNVKWKTRLQEVFQSFQAEPISEETNFSVCNAEIGDVNLNCSLCTFKWQLASKS